MKSETTLGPPISPEQNFWRLQNSTEVISKKHTPKSRPQIIVFFSKKNERCIESEHAENLF